MTITTDVRINYPVDAIGLLDHVTRVAGGDPATIKRKTIAAGEEFYGSADSHHRTWNQAGQGLRTLASVAYSEHGVTTYDGECPPALVIIDVDNPYGFGPPENTGCWVQAYEILPAIVEWLDDQSVPRDAWWWEDESAGTWHPGTTPVQALYDSDIERETWTR